MTSIDGLHDGEPVAHVEQEEEEGQDQPPKMFILIQKLLLSQQMMKIMSLIPYRVLSQLLLLLPPSCDKDKKALQGSKMDF